MLINSKEDLDSLSLVNRERALILIAQSVLNWEWDSELKDWALKEDFSFVDRLGLSLGDLPDVDPPTKPPISEPELPQPNWEQFNSVAMADPVLNNAIALTMGIAPLAALSLSATLIKAESGKLTEFETAFNVVVQSAQVPNVAIDNWIDIATDNNLPADFIDILEQSKTPLT